MMMDKYVNHVTLSTGHCRRSPRSEVSDEVLAILHPWLVSALAAGGPVPLPAPGLAHYSARVLREPGMAGLMVTIYAPLGPHVPGQPYRGERVAPLVTLGIAQRSREAAPLWRIMVEAFGAHPDARMPATPWCAVALHAPLSAHPEALEWLGGLERCIAWAWMTRNPALSSVTGAGLRADITGYSAD